jgi:serine/threonine protein kinase
VATADLYGLVGQVLDGQFRVDRPIGEGGFSVVYAGMHIGLDEPVAIKCLKLQSQLGSAVVEAFIRRFREKAIHYRLSRLLHIPRDRRRDDMAPATGAWCPTWCSSGSRYTLSEELRAESSAAREGGMQGLALARSGRRRMAFAHAWASCIAI